MPPARAARKDAEGYESPLGESLVEARRRALAVSRALARAYPDARIPLVFSSPLELMIATILSAQCTDAKVNEVTATLFRKYRTAEDWASADRATLEREVHSTGFFRNKAKAIIDAAQDLTDKHGGSVPDSMEELTALRGIGRKSANVILDHAFGKPGIIVDTHFSRITRRLGLTSEFDPVKIEFDLMDVVPEKHRSQFSLMVNWHGRVTCYARKPECERCAVRKRCPAFGSAGDITWPVKTRGGAKRPQKR